MQKKLLERSSLCLYLISFLATLMICSQSVAAPADSSSAAGTSNLLSSFTASTESAAPAAGKAGTAAGSDSTGSGSGALESIAGAMSSGSGMIPGASDLSVSRAGFNGMNHNMPFIPAFDTDGNIVIVSFTILGQSYIYKHSIELIYDPDEVTLKKPALPPATPHEDALGPSEVYFSGLKFTFPVRKAVPGAAITIKYQGCDESGICYPPQTYNISLPESLIETLSGSAPASDKADTTSAEGAAGSASAAAAGVDSTYNPAPGSGVNLLSEHERASGEGQKSSSLFEFVSSSNAGNGDAISQLLSDNLLLGLLILFILGIGLDLTPCVLPMLPIFSTMVIGSRKSTVKSTDVIDIAVAAQSQSGSSRVRRMNYVFFQNLGFALGLALTYTLLGLLFSMAGAHMHSFLQSTAMNYTLAILMIICALACADVFELKMPAFITSRLQSRASRLNTSSFPGAFILGAIAALIASPCTSAPLAGALLYVMKNGDTLMGSLVFFTIGMGMATPLFIIGMFGSRFLHKSGIIGDIIKRLMVVALLVTAYIIVRHTLGRAEVLIGALTVYIICVYTMVSAVFFIRRRALPMITATMIAVFALAPTYWSMGYFEQSTQHHAYRDFYSASDMHSLSHITEGNYSMIVFTAEWCANCKSMERQIYSSAHFLDISSDILRVVVNITDTDNTEIAGIIKHYNVIGVPYFITVDNKGNIVDSHLGLAPPATVFEAVHRLQSKSDK
ncbi:cytochrome c biogenesis protein CcdA [Anaerobiospirillum sp. NML120449]|uniref:cytochrome c biogenesis protein CcdA n=1 Tax=Anaerobiospirillum sp. NML120449 TaxID=2932817 RepID=UPI001FF32A9F|nr:cytochrome c biogenesis protein CcdA [Anaerobiospirillum sp. NML120449]MCK0527018.1 sulfite exporter TauE/SafE family protein [Anaerobiospirillum sp. NML120449]